MLLCETIPGPWRVCIEKFVSVLHFAYHHVTHVHNVKRSLDMRSDVTTDSLRRSKNGSTEGNGLYDTRLTSYHVAEMGGL